MNVIICPLVIIRPPDKEKHKVMDLVGKRIGDVINYHEMNLISVKAPMRLPKAKCS